MSTLKNESIDVFSEESGLLTGDRVRRSNRRAFILGIAVGVVAVAAVVAVVAVAAGSHSSGDSDSNSSSVSSRTEFDRLRDELRSAKRHASELEDEHSAQVDMIFRLKQQRKEVAGRYWTEFCAPGCPTYWMHDGICDTDCFTPSCLMDMGDCSAIQFPWNDGSGAGTGSGVDEYNVRINEDALRGSNGNNGNGNNGNGNGNNGNGNGNGNNGNGNGNGN
eukprot:Rmarinus@m.22665